MAALVAVVGVLIFGGVLDVRLVRSALLLNITDSFTLDYALTAFVLSMIAMALAYGLLLSTPRPRMFFTWIIVLATVAGTAAPFVIGSETSSQVATACINLALGICVLSLLRSVMARTVRPGAACDNVPFLNNGPGPRGGDQHRALLSVMLGIRVVTVAASASLSSLAGRA